MAQQAASQANGSDVPPPPSGQPPQSQQQYYQQQGQQQQQQGQGQQGQQQWNTASFPSGPSAQLYYHALSSLQADYQQPRVAPAPRYQNGYAQEQGNFPRQGSNSSLYQQGSGHSNMQRGGSGQVPLSPRQKGLGEGVYSVDGRPQPPPPPGPPPRANSIDTQPAPPKVPPPPGVRRVSSTGAGLGEFSSGTVAAAAAAAAAATRPRGAGPPGISAPSSKMSDTSSTAGSPREGSRHRPPPGFVKPTSPAVSSPTASSTGSGQHHRMQQHMQRRGEYPPMAPGSRRASDGNRGGGGGVPPSPQNLPPGHSTRIFRQGPPPPPGPPLSAQRVPQDYPSLLAAYKRALNVLRDNKMRHINAEEALRKLQAQNGELRKAVADKTKAVEEAQRAHMNSMRNYSAMLEEMQRAKAEAAKAEDLMEPFAQQLQTVMQEKSHLLKEIQERDNKVQVLEERLELLEAAYQQVMAGGHEGGGADAAGHHSKPLAGLMVTSSMEAEAFAAMDQLGLGPGEHEAYLYGEHGQDEADYYVTGDYPGSSQGGDYPGSPRAEGEYPGQYSAARGSGSSGAGGGAYGAGGPQGGDSMEELLADLEERYGPAGGSGGGSQPAGGDAAAGEDGAEAGGDGRAAGKEEEEAQ